MSWTLLNLQTGFTVEIRNPEMGDTIRYERRQASGETEGGRVFTQDLGITDRFVEASWSGVTRCEKDDLLAFLESVLYRARSFLLYSTGGGAQVPAQVSPANWSGRVRFDQSRVEFRDSQTDAPRAGVSERFEFTLRLRLVPLEEVVLFDSIEIADNVVIALEFQNLVQLLSHRLELLYFPFLHLCLSFAYINF